MKIQGKTKVLQEYKSTVRQPFPVSKATVTVGDKTADLVILTGNVQYVIDGKTYYGCIAHVLWELKANANN